MWYAGVGWRGTEYVAAALDGDGTVAGSVVAGSVAFGAGDADALVAELRGWAERAGGLACVIDSTTGVLERRLVESGLDVYRADPWQLPGRTDGGSADPVRLAEAARSATRLTAGSGAMAGRDDVGQSIRDSAAVEADLARDGRLVARGAGARREVALTFDDGPDPRHTPAVLDVLRRYGAAATFFCVGLNAHAYPGIVERIATDGHELGNHTWSHPYLPDLSGAELDAQVAGTNEAVARATGRPPALFRPPFGGRTGDALRRLAAAGMTTVLWDIDTSDWARPGADAIEHAAVDAVSDGSIVLMHDGGGDRSQTVAALDGMLRRLSERGFRMVTVGQLG